MHLENLGNSVNAIKDIQNVLDYMSQYKGLGVAPVTIEKLEQATSGYSTEVLKLATSQVALSKNQATAIFTAKGLSGAELDAAVKAAMLSTAEKEATVSTFGLSSAVKGLGAQFKAFAIAHPILLAITATIAAIGVGYKVFDLLTVSVEEAKDALEDSKSAFASVNDKLKSVNTELDTNKKRIEELNQLDKLTYLEKNELENLQAVTKELERQKNILSIEQENAATKLSKENKTAFDKEYGDNNFSVKDVMALESEYGDLSFSPTSDIALAQVGLEGLAAALVKVQKAKSDAESSGDTEWLNSLVEREENYKTTLEDNLSTLQDYRNNLTSIMKFRELTAEEKEFYDNLEQGLKLIYQFTDPNIWNDMEVNDVFNVEGIEKTKTELIELANSGKLNEDIVSNYPKLSAAIKEMELIAQEGQSPIQAFIDEIYALAKASETLEESSPVPLAATKPEMIEKINSLSDGFESLDKIMNSMQGKNPFDYSLLDDKKFKDNFSNLGDAYSDFIEKISNSPKDIAANQSAFDDLVTAWLKGSGALDGLSEETASVTEAMLTNMGVTNAAEVVSMALANSKAKAITASYDLIDAETDEALAFVNTVMASDEAKEAVARYTLQKITSNGITLTTDGDIENVKSLVTAVGGAVTALNAYNRARQGMLELIETSPGYKAFQDPSSFLPGQMEIEQAAWEKKNLASIKAKGEEYANSLKAAEEEIKSAINAPATYGGGTKTNKSSSSGKDKKEKEPKTKDFDWISRRQELLQKLHDKEMENANDESASYQTRIALTDNLIAKDKERLAFNEQAAASYSKVWEEAKEKILAEAAKQNQDGNGIIASIMEGNIEDQTITDKTDEHHLIDAVEAAVKAYDNLTEGQKKSEEISKEIDEHLKKQLELKLAITQAQVDLVKAEADSLNTEIQLMEATGKAVTEKQLKKQISLSEDLVDSYYDQISALQDQLDQQDEGSAEYYSLLSQINQCEAAIADCAVQQAEWNDQIKRLPIERINKFLELLGFIKEDLQNFIDQQNALGKATTLLQYEELGKINTTQLKKLAEQQKLLSDLLNDYEYGSTKYQDTVSDLQDIDNEISSLIQNQYDWNKAILQLPIDQLSKAGDVLQNAVTAMSEILADYDSAISAVTGTLDKQIKAINDLKDATTDEYESKIKPLQDELDTLQKQNEARKIQLDLEKAQSNLDRAKEQKTNKVIRDGEINYEADQDAIRAAQNEKNDAEYNKTVHDLETQISNLEEERDKLLEGYDDQIEKLDEIKDRWSSIVEEIKLAADALKANDVLGAGWQDKILSGNDEEMLNSLKDLYTTISDQKNQYEEQIASNERIADIMNQFMESWQNGSITYDQAMAGIKDLANQMKDGYSSLEHLDAIMGLNGATDLGSLLDKMQNGANASVNQFEDYMKVVKANSDALSEYNSSWEEMQQNIKDQIAALEKLAEEAAKVVNTINKHSSSSGGGSKGPNVNDKNFVNSGPGVALANALAEKEIPKYHEGGVVRAKDSNGKFIELVSAKDLNPDEVPAILKKGEFVMTPEQQNMLKENFINYSLVSYKTPTVDMSSLAVQNRNLPPNVTVTMGDVNLPNVKDPDGFMRFIKSNFDLAMGQEYSKTFR